MQLVRSYTNVSSHTAQLQDTLLALCVTPPSSCICNEGLQGLSTDNEPYLSVCTSNIQTQKTQLKPVCKTTKPLKFLNNEADSMHSLKKLKVNCYFVFNIYIKVTALFKKNKQKKKH